MSRKNEKMSSSGLRDGKDGKLPQRTNSKREEKVERRTEGNGDRKDEASYEERKSRRSLFQSGSTSNLSTNHQVREGSQI